MTAFIARRPANSLAEPRMTPVASRGPAPAVREAASPNRRRIDEKMDRAQPRTLTVKPEEFSSRLHRPSSWSLFQPEANNNVTSPVALSAILTNQVLVHFVTANRGLMKEEAGFSSIC